MYIIIRVIVLFNITQMKDIYSIHELYNPDVK